MAYFIRDDRMTQREADQRNHGKPERYHIVNTSPGLSAYRDDDGKLCFIHSAPTVMHDKCVKASIPGVEYHGDPSHEKITASHDARDAWAAQFGPGHALCWDRLYTNDPERAPACFFCGEPVVGRG